MAASTSAVEFWYDRGASSARLLTDAFAQGSILMSSHYPMAPERRVTVVGEHRVATLDLQVGSLLVSEGRNEVLKVQETLPSKAETGMEENVWCAGSVLIGKAIQEAVAARVRQLFAQTNYVQCQAHMHSPRAFSLTRLLAARKDRLAAGPNRLLLRRWRVRGPVVFAQYDHSADPTR